MKKDAIYIIVIVILLGIIAILSVNLGITKNRFSNAEKSNESVPSQKNLKNDPVIDDLVKQVNLINSNFNSDTLTEDGAFKNNKVDCLQYDFQRTINNTPELITNMRNIYDNFDGSLHYSITQITYHDGRKEENLYVCVPEKCQIPIIDYYDIVKEDNGKKKVLFNGKYTFEVINKNNKWQFSSTFMFCDK